MRRVLLCSLIFIAQFFDANASPIEKQFVSCPLVHTVWRGTGSLSNWLMGDCRYKAILISEPLSYLEDFLLRIKVKKSSGGIFCPKRGKTKFFGICKRGQITIYTGRGNLEGELSRSGGVANGKIWILPGVRAKLSMEFKRLYSIP